MPRRSVSVGGEVGGAARDQYQLRGDDSRVVIAGALAELFGQSAWFEPLISIDIEQVNIRKFTDP